MAHTAPAAPFDLHHTRIGKGVMKTFRINCQWGSELFLLINFNFSNRKTMMNALHLTNAPRLWKECLTDIGQGATAFVAAYTIVNEFIGALLTFKYF
jgi:hypothetical protein